MKTEVLIVEDDPAFRERLAKALEARNVTVATCANAADALSLVTITQFSGAVVDLRLPDVSGLELVKSLRQHSPGLRIVVLTGFGSIATAIEAVRNGACDYLTKPADPDEILAALRGQRASAASLANPWDEIPSLGRVEWEHIQRVLAECSGNISQAARVLGIDRRSLQRKLAKYPPRR